MANVKISQLPAATTPLTGAELVPVVQSGVTKQAAIGSAFPNVRYFQTYATMTALTVPNGLVAGAIYEVGGRTAAGDGGGGMWRVVAGTTTPNGGTLLNHDTLSFYFERVYTGALQARWFTPFDNSTDETTTLQAAITASTNAVLELPPATALCNGGLTGVNGITLRGTPGVSTLKRKNSAGVATSILQFSTKNAFNITGVVFDGNKANNATNPATNLAIDTSCYNFKVQNCTTKNAKAVGGSYGGGFTVADSADFANNTWSLLADNTVLDNDTYGCSVYRCLNIRVEGNYAEGHTANAGINIDDFTLPVPANPTNMYIVVSRNICTGNAIGIEVFGFRSGTSALGDIASNTSFVTRSLVVSDNVCYANTIYGIAVQADNVAVTGNVLDTNGSDTSNGNMLLSCANFVCSGNTLRKGYFFGVDAGGARDGLISGNYFSETGSTANQCIALNLGGTRYVTVQGNKFSNNGGTGLSGGAYNIFAARFDGGSATNWFPWSGAQLTLKANDISINATPVVGINISQGFSGCAVRNNIVRLVAAGIPMQLYTPGSATSVEGNEVISGGSWIPIVASAATLVLPDYARNISIAGTATISNIRTTSSDAMYQKVAFTLATSGGSGYTSVPTVSFTGGGGSGAAGTAVLGADGVIYGVYVTNNGSGYTSAPTVGFSGGGGSGAAATASVGVEPPYGREVTLMFDDAAILDTGPGNIYLSSDKTGSALGLSWTKLGFRYSNVYEISRGI